MTGKGANPSSCGDATGVTPAKAGEACPEPLSACRHHSNIYAANGPGQLERALTVTVELIQKTKTPLQERFTAILPREPTAPQKLHTYNRLYLERKNGGRGKD